MIKFSLKLLLFIILTVLTQIGGVIYLLSGFINKKVKFKKKYLRCITFPIIYLAFTFVFIPQLAKLNGRTSLSVFTNPSLKPLTIWTCILNRHYVKPKLKKTLLELRYKIGDIYYLDASFPFFDGFPLLPHWSHNDGKKIDLAFIYKDKDGNYGDHPSFIGYGICEKPKKGEVDMPKKCAKQGFFQYSILKYIIPQSSKEGYILDEKRTKDLVKSLASSSSINKIFIEPHLKTRWGFSNNSKIRFHGCHAVRHDDHIHVQL